MKYVTFRLDRDWHDKKIELEEGTILKFLGQDYKYDEKHTLLAFEVIGHPVEKTESITFVYK